MRHPTSLYYEAYVDEFQFIWHVQGGQSLSLQQVIYPAIILDCELLHFSLQIFYLFVNSTSIGTPIIAAAEPPCQLSPYTQHDY